MFFSKKPVIEFVSVDPAYRVLDHPENARKFLPNWIKRMKEQTSERVGPNEDKIDTVRKCVPFLDAMRIGYVIPSPCDVHFKVTNYGKNVDTQCRSQLNLQGSISEFISGHNLVQMSPQSPYRGTILKWINPWKINTKKGYSCLFVTPISHGNRHYEAFSGVVDTDNYHNIINFPFRILNPDNKESFEFFIKKGEPIIQVIPFKRSEAYGKCNVKKANTIQEWKREMKDQDNVAGNWSWYREKQVEKKITLEK